MNRTLQTSTILSNNLFMRLEAKDNWTHVSGNTDATYKYAVRKHGGRKQLLIMCRAAEMKYQTIQNDYWFSKVHADFPDVEDKDVLFVLLGNNRVRSIRGRNVITIDVNTGRIKSSCLDDVFDNTYQKLKQILKSMRAEDEAKSYALYGSTFSRNYGYLAVGVIALMMILLYDFFDTPSMYGVSANEVSVIRYGTYLFAHANMTHLMGNVLSLIILGIVYTTEQSGLAFLICFFAGGFASAVISQTVNSLTGSGLYTIGASGAIFAVFAAGIMVQIIKGTANGWLIARAVLVLALSNIGGGVDVACHIGGVIFGLLFGWGWYYISQNADFKRAQRKTKQIVRVKPRTNSKTGRPDLTGW